jgi:hypothetical protein
MAILAQVSQEDAICYNLTALLDSCFNASGINILL